MDSASGQAVAPASLNGIGQIALTVTDVERAIAFYRDSLGMKFLFQFPNLGFFDCGGVRLMLTGSDKPLQTDGYAIYFKVPEIRQAHGELVKRGVVFDGEPHRIARMPDHDLWMAFFRDPDRNILALMSEEPRG